MNLLLSVDGLKEGLSDWAPAAEWAVALGTIVLAFATFRLAKRAKEEAEAVRKEAELLTRQVELATEQLAVSERSCVYPITPQDWSLSLGDGGRWLAFRNGGSGIARNARGRVWWHERGGGYDETALLGQTLAANDHSRLRLGDGKAVSRWWGVEGFIFYEDVRGNEWQSHFRYEYSGREVWARLLEWGPSEEIGDPYSEFPRKGWAEEQLPDEPEPERYRTMA
jgi:hypothetical protein